VCRAISVLHGVGAVRAAPDVLPAYPTARERIGTDESDTAGLTATATTKEAFGIVNGEVRCV